MQIEKITQILSFPHSVFISVILGIMILSFPIGAYVVFNSDIGNEINFQYPLNGFNFFVAGIGYKIPASFEIGNCFILVWSIYLILFAIALIGPKSNVMKTLGHMLPEGWKNSRENYIIDVITWFTILILISLTIDLIQSGFGVKIESPTSQNNLINFFQLTLSPLTEEFGFRVILIGIPLFLLFAQNVTWRTFFKSLWRPSAYLQITNSKKVLALIIAVGIFFGVAHIISGNPWSTGKFTQAAIAGSIIGWVYVRYGLAPAILIHWATNFFITSYSYFMSNLSQIPISRDFSDPFSNMLEILLIVTGIISLTIKILNYIESRKKSTPVTQI
ncbi:MAG TPA: CPBP family intramembrane glutamic endopeptidase [Candidatus Bathyarchaeia archaeon]|nr:CPBP family intramembrane glutamic endopeptidase [Candidatus Bathyarchaeia archaeon]